jgi:predicted ester cyclase
VEAGRPSSRKDTVARWVDEVINRGNLEVADELCTPEAAARTRTWVEPFREAFPDVRMEAVELVAEEEIVVGRFRCSATHTGPWGDHAPSGRRFEDVDEVYFFHFAGERIAGYWGIEDGLSRLRQLGFLES